MLPSQAAPSSSSSSAYEQIGTNITDRGVQTSDGRAAVRRADLAWIRSTHIAMLVAFLAGELFLWVVSDSTHDSPRGVAYWPNGESLDPQVQHQSRYPRVVVAFVTLGLAVCIQGFYLFSTHRDESSISTDLAQRCWPRTWFVVSVLNILVYTMLADACGERDSTKQTMLVVLVGCANVFQWMSESFSRAELRGTETYSAKIMFLLGMPPFAVAWAMMFYQLHLSREALPLTTTWGKWRLALPVVYHGGELALLVCTLTRIWNRGSECARVCFETALRGSLLMMLCLTVGQT